MDRSEFALVCIEDIPKDFIAEYNPIPSVHNVWIYFEIVKGYYGIPQAGMMAKNLLNERLNKAVYYKPTTTSVLWCHKWRPVMFVLIFKTFGI